MKNEITLKYKDVLNAIKYIENHCLAGSVNLKIGLAKIEICCDDKTIILYDKDNHMMPRVSQESLLGDQN